jgi:hypothetical protein
MTKRDNDNKSKNNNNKQRGSRGKNNRKAPKTLDKRPKHEKLEIKFDPAARREYLTGASSRKNDRRAYGLAMQKVKDRKAKIEQRRDEKEATMEQIEEAERMKKNDLFNDYSSGEEDEEDTKDEGDATIVQKYEDESTQNQFGGQVIVTTSFGLPEDESDGEDADPKPKQIDQEQRFAGSVMKYMTKLQKKMPSKKHQSGSRGGSKGQHGAQGMIGGNSKDLKMAKKSLSRAEGTNGKRGRGGSDGGKKGKKGKGRR